MLVWAGGVAAPERAPTIAAPGARISGLLRPVRLGPPLENQHGSPPTAARAPRVGSGEPPTASRSGTGSGFTAGESMLSQLLLLIVQPTPMIDGLVAGRLMVPSRTA